jgi:peptidyl-prolyl cis-trans isomerase C
MRIVQVFGAAAVTAGCLWLAASDLSRAEEAGPPMPMPADLFDMPIPVPPTPPPIPPADAVAAVINGVELKQATVNEYIARAIRGSGESLPAEREQEIRGMLNEQITEDLVTQMILEQAADAQNITVTDAQVDEAITQIPLPDGVTLEKALEEQAMTRDALVRDIRRALKIDQLLKSHAEKAPGPTDEEVKAFYEENKERFEQPETITASHILIAVPEGADDATKAEKKAQTEKIRKELVDGADFAETAKKYSEDPGSKDRAASTPSPAA